MESQISRRVVKFLTSSIATACSWYLGKWCKRVQAKVSTPPAGSVQGSTAPSLIAVGADGRGGRKFSYWDQSHVYFMNDKENSTLAKRCKVGSNTSSSLQFRGCLQIEHFFEGAYK